MTKNEFISIVNSVGIAAREENSISKTAGYSRRLHTGNITGLTSWLPVMITAP